MDHRLWAIIYGLARFYHTKNKKLFNFYTHSSKQNETYMKRETAKILKPELIQQHGIPADEIPKASRNFKFSLLSYQ